ncbi:tankyrase-2-like [Trichogramma pretiosum]|uniref:tankyrase-2-like n=1 Tax=Trichogramma pretiosum TaxID=7493 RepID=UPI000C71996D|nr:tankyrase-2-like [Trichogramma pretiosum]
MAQDEQNCLKKLKDMREEFDWEVEEERRTFFFRLLPLISEWEGQLPDLRDVFKREEIDWLLTTDVKYEISKFLDFVVRSGYEDEPEIDKNGEPVLRRDTPVHYATERGYVHRSVIDNLFKIYKRFDANYIGESGLTHFHAACKYGRDELVEKFLRLGQDPNCGLQSVKSRCWTPLRYALSRDHGRVIELLLRHGADPNLADSMGTTAMHYICDLDSQVVFARMVFDISEEEQRHPVRVDALDILGRTPLHVALGHGHADQVELLLRKGANPNFLDGAGRHPLHIIGGRGREWLMDDDLVTTYFRVSEEKRLTLQLNARDRWGRTPLHLAVASLDNEEMARLLLRHGADPTLVDEDGSTPLCSRLGESDSNASLLFSFLTVTLW